MSGISGKKGDDRPQVVVVTGPTATGKSALGIELALRLGGEIVSADSMQVYRHMDIGTAKPSEEEKRGVRHHMIDVASPFENYSVARYVQEASACVDAIISRGNLPIVVGGTGLYIESLLSGREFAKQGDLRLRRELSGEYDRLGGPEMLEKLRKIDPKAASRIHPNDKKRIVRALEVFFLTGKPLSDHDERTKAAPPRYRALVVALNFDCRADLYARIDKRVDDMMEKGLLDEVRRLIAMGLSRENTAMQAIGYKELAEVVLGGATLWEAVEKIKRESRRYAKRQLSWLRREGGVRWITWRKEPDFDSGVQIATQYLEDCGYNGAV